MAKTVFLEKKSLPLSPLYLSSFFSSSPASTPPIGMLTKTRPASDLCADEDEEVAQPPITIIIVSINTNKTRISLIYLLLCLPVLIGQTIAFLGGFVKPDRQRPPALADGLTWPNSTERSWVIPPSSPPRNG
ncbi:hypothetical protein JW899_04270 [Candidatus Uhrbacteria bacterium]|nr:hypothetical protein [Candidatus Uhrbacteria bacterium]